ncbi:MAG: sterol desaturase family protein, partial [Bacteroidota bacterium]
MGGLQYAALIIPVLMLLVVLEYWIARKKGVDAFSFSDTIVNMCCGMLERLFDVFWVVMLYFVFGFLFNKVALWQIPNNGWTFILALLFADLMAYWHHRLSHEINFLWAAHIVHHQSEELNVTTVFRVSAFAVINRSFFFIWMPMLGFSPELTTGAIVFVGLYQFVTHTRLVGKLGFIEYIMVTPSHHRVHHARNEKYLDKNYGHVFIIWDRLFGTFTEEDEEPDYGITTGFESANPYRAYLWYWKDLFRRAGETEKFIDKIRVFTKPPSWNPDDVEITPSEFSVDAEGNRKKYRLEMPFRLQLYVLVHTIATLGAFLGIMVLKNTFEHPSVIDLLSDMT